MVLKGYTDADWGADKNDRKSITGYIFFLGRAACCTKSKKQQTIGGSMMEVEYMATYFAISEAIWI